MCQEKCLNNKYAEERKPKFLVTAQNGPLTKSSGKQEYKEQSENFSFNLNWALLDMLISSNMKSQESDG